MPGDSSFSSPAAASVAAEKAAYSTTGPLNELQPSACSANDVNGKNEKVDVGGGRGKDQGLRGRGEAEMKSFLRGRTPSPLCPGVG